MERRESEARRNGRRGTVYDPTSHPDGGSQYKGEWRDDLPHGEGTRVIWADGGSVYEGQWERGRRHGRGKLYRIATAADGTRRSHPARAHGHQPEQPHRLQPSQRSMPTAEQLVLVYDGEWRDDLFDGQGTCYYPDGSRYTGQWLEQQRSGQGTHTTGDQHQVVYSGQWLHDKRHGSGQLTLANGDVYRGQWANDQKHGQGVFTYTAKNRQLVGEWRCDKFQCGEMMDVDGARSQLPALELASPDAVLLQRRQELAPSMGVV